MTSDNNHLNQNCLLMCHSFGFRVEGILHLASVLGVMDLEQSFQHLTDELVYHLFNEKNHTESITPLIPPLTEKDESLFRLYLHDHWIRTKQYGFVILITSPNYSKDKTPNICKKWFYGDNYYEAFERVLSWITTGEA